MAEDDLLAGRYRRERLLGSGAMGQVWLAEDQVLHRMVAVKNVTGAGATSGLATPAQDDLLNRMLREAHLAARINHPNAVAVYDLVTVHGVPYVVMEYVPGHTLAEEIRSAGRLDPPRVATIGAAVADALAEAHALGIVHRDVKPANILLDARGNPKLADFGIARVGADASSTMTGVLLGTPAFVAPEVARGEQAAPAADVWSLGVTLYAALTGHSPFQVTRDDMAIVVLGRVLSGNVPPLTFGGTVAHAVMRMLELDPRARPTAAEAAVLLRGQVDSAADRTARHPAVFAAPPHASWPPAAPPYPAAPGPRPPYPATPGPSPQPKRRGFALAWVALAVIVLVGAGATAYLTTRPSGGSPRSTSAAVGAPDAGPSSQPAPSSPAGGGPAISQPPQSTTGPTFPATAGSAPVASSVTAAATTVDNLLDQSESARSGVQPALDAIGKCAASESDIQALQSAGHVRRGLVGQLGSIDFAALPGGHRLENTLAHLLTVSADADFAYVRWGDDQFGCTGHAATDAGKRHGDAFSREATSSKERFLRLWNPIASANGLATRTEAQI